MIGTKHKHNIHPLESLPWTNRAPPIYLIIAALPNAYDLQITMIQSQQSTILVL